MGDSQRPPESVNHAQAAKSAAARARSLLSPVLRMLQEAALADNDAKAQARLLRAAEQVAETSSMLFELEHEKKSAFDSLTSAVRARDHLRAALSALQAPEMAGRFPAECADIVASALAIIFSAAKGGDWQDRESLRRARKRALLMRVPQNEAADDSPEASRQAPSRPPEAESVPPIPLSRRRAPAPAAPSSDDPISQAQFYPESKRADPRKWNRRITGRSVLEVDVGLVSESQFYAGLSMDLSTGGIFVATYQSKPVGTPVAVSLVLPGGQSVWAKGVVRWVREPSGEDDVPGMGVEFTEIEPADLEAIKHFCTMRAPMYFESDEPEER
jgi:uncharacterized protein (TIGR02266 family)